MKPERDPRPLPWDDLASVVIGVGDAWEALRGARVFVTGGTGFFGRWMVESLLAAHAMRGIDAEIVVLTRDPEAFAAAVPHVAGHPSVRLHAGDVRTFDYPLGGYSHVLHMASYESRSESPTASSRTAIEGMERVLDFAATRGVRDLLFTSSGAIYGPQPSDLASIPEEYIGSPRIRSGLSAVADDYADGKRAAEVLCFAASDGGRVAVKIARCFAFVGPLLPLDSHFAIGNFIGDVLSGSVVVIKSDGTTRRSYLYAADLAIWLWTILIRGRAGYPYNVGSADDLSIFDLAQRIVAILDPVLPIRIDAAPQRGTAPTRYVPSTARAEAELGLSSRVDLDEGIRRMARWHVESNQSSGPHGHDGLSCRDGDRINGARNQCE